MSEQDLNAQDNHAPDRAAQSHVEKAAGRTTFDITEDAQEAVRRFQTQQADSLADAQPAVVNHDNVHLRIEVQDSKTPLLLTLTDKAVIGRRDPAVQAVPELDLTPYGGYQMGISRRHAILSARDGHLELLDLGSRNGTYIDGRRLNPHQPHPLRDGAEVRLGKIVMIIHVQ